MNTIKKAKKLITKLGLMPPNVLTPHKLASYFTDRTYAYTSPEELAGLYGVGRSLAWMGHSSLPPQETSKRTIALIGKGITFDSGGVSIKPSYNMHHMKFDMLGAATVLGACQDLKDLKETHIEAYGCCAENTFHNNALRPGDVITYPNGSRVEIINTDAEGRLVLADGILQSKEYKPDLIITIATLTGAARAALGDATALFSNNDDYASKFLSAAADCKELIWRLPIWDIHRKDIKVKNNKVADIKNQGTMAGASTAAAFLEHFIGDTPWIHLDIAGSAYKAEEPTGAMLESLVTFIRRIDNEGS